MALKRNSSKTAKRSVVSARSLHSKTPSGRVKKAKIVKYTPNSGGKALAKRKSNPIVRFIKKPVTKISAGTLLLAGAAFIAIDNIVPSLESIQGSVVEIEACNKLNYDCGSGSGFAAFRDNYLVTNYHVIQGSDTIKIKTVAGVEGKATNIIVFDAEKDIAIIEWDRTLPPIRIGSSEGAKVGDKVLAIGNPLSETNVVSEGIISSKTSERGLMTTAAISPGSSGGALILDSNHRVIGVTYMKLTNGESMNYAVKIEDVSKVFDQYNRKEAFMINKASIDSCHTTLDKIALTYKNLAFSGCKSSSVDAYTTSSLEAFYNATNDRARFEYALAKRSDWKVVYDRLSSLAKNALVYTLDDNKSSAFNTNWKFAIWFANEYTYYECQTTWCMVTRYRNGYYPTANSGATISELEKL